MISILNDEFKYSSHDIRYMVLNMKSDTHHMDVDPDNSVSQLN